MKNITKKYTIKAPISSVWRALTDPSVIQEWSGVPAIMTTQLVKFSLWGGDIHGINTEVAENELLKQDWYSEDWAQPSKVTFTLEVKKNNTVLTLLHEGFPEAEAKDLEHGWEEFYLKPIKQLLEEQYSN